MTNFSARFLQRTKSWRTIAALMLATALLVGVNANNPAHAQTYTVLQNFPNTHVGPATFWNPGLVAQGRDGSLYTTSTLGGAAQKGSAFKVTTAGKVTVLQSFGTDEPRSGLVLGTDGYFYGATTNGGTWTFGSVFKLNGRGELTTEYSFYGYGDAIFPVAPPIQSADGSFYGTATHGGLSDLGAIYKLTPSGEYTLLYQFPADGTQGSVPYAPLLQAADGNFYGTTSGEGFCQDCGSIFKLTPAGVLTTLHTFSGSYGANPDSALVQGSDGNFYGTTENGGDISCGYGCGVVFKLTPAGVFSVLHSFNMSDGANPTGGLVQVDGNFYGTTMNGGTLNYGTIFSINRQGDFSVIHNFDKPTGSIPRVGLVQHTNGLLYGFTMQGGTRGGFFGGGVFYSLDIGAIPFVRLLPLAGRVGNKVEVLGQGFTGTTRVAFDGVPASFTVKSDTFLTATIPAGAKTGNVTVATPSGTLASNQKFWVRR